MKNFASTTISLVLVVAVSYAGYLVGGILGLLGVIAILIAAILLWVRYIFIARQALALWPLIAKDKKIVHSRLRSGRFRLNEDSDTFRTKTELVAFGMDGLQVDAFERKKRLVVPFSGAVGFENDVCVCINVFPARWNPRTDLPRKPRIDKAGALDLVDLNRPDLRKWVEDIDLDSPARSRVLFWTGVLKTGQLFYRLEDMKWLSRSGRAHPESTKDSRNDSKTSPPSQGNPTPTDPAQGGTDSRDE